MHQKMSTVLKNWKLNLLGLICVCLLAKLGFWQLSRAEYKKALLQSFNERTIHAPLNGLALNTPNDWRFYQATLNGSFDNQHSLFLDNKTYNGKIGYEVYTLFYADGMTTVLLVDRGFISNNNDRAHLPTIKPINGRVTIHGMINLPPTYVSLGQMIDGKSSAWPMRVEYLHPASLGKIIQTSLYPYVLTLDPKSPYALDATAIDWRLFPISPERHMGYAVQWFALALTLLVICAALNYKQHKKNKK
jgi:surfeit locus 1 family protein